MAEEKRQFNNFELEEIKKIILLKRQKAQELLEELKSRSEEIELRPVSFKIQKEGSKDKQELIEEQIRQLSFIGCLDFALMRMNNNHFGYCSKCGNLMSFERLKAVPHATKCCSCKI